MKRLALALGAVVSVSAQSSNCTNTGISAYSDPYFNWLVSGTSDVRATKVAAICASADNVDRTRFYNKLNDLLAACVPPGTDVSTSAFGIIVALLNKVLCEQKTDLGNLRYCILSLLPLFDTPYFLSLSQGVFTVPPLKPVGDSTDRQSAMCASNICNAYIENIVPGLLSQLPQTGTAATAATFIRATVSRMRCGCTGQVDPCQGTKVTNELIANGAFVEAKACDASGMPTECARNWITCENIPPPQCARPCLNKKIASIEFVLKNLNYDCLVNAGNSVENVKADIIANVPGLLKSDFTCSCSASVAPQVGTTCKCEITCGNLLTPQNVNLAREFLRLSARAGAVVVPTPLLDRLLPQSCKITANAESFGTGFVLVSSSVQANDGDGYENGAASVGISAAIATALVASVVF